MIKFIVKAAIRRLKRNFVRSKCFLEYGEIQRVLLFFNSEHTEAVETIIHSLESDGKHVLALCIEDTNVKGEPKPLPNRVRMWKKTDLSLSGIPKQACVDEIEAYPADTLLDLTMRPSLVHDLMYYHTKASYRVGFGRQEPSMFDLLVTVDDQHEAPFFFSQLLFYLKSMRTHQ